jgi:hypothetical protein
VAGPLVVGGERTTTGTLTGLLTGQIDKVSIWNRQIEARERINATNGVDPSSLQMTHAISANWPLNDAAGSTFASDQSGYGFPLILSGAPLPNFGTPSGSTNSANVLTLASASSQLASTASQRVDPSGPFAASVFVNLTDNTQSGTLIRVGNGSADEWAITYRYNATVGQGNFVFGRSKTGTAGSARDEVLSPPVTPSLSGGWQNVIAVYDPNHQWQNPDGVSFTSAPGIAVYLDGAPSSTVEWVPASATWSDASSITTIGWGAAGSGSGFLNAQLQDIRLFSGALSFNDIQTMSSAPFSG